MKKKYYKNTHFHVQKRNLICFSWKKNMAWHTKVKWLVPYFIHFNWSFFEISLTFISPKPSPKPSIVQLLSTRHVTKVHLLQKFLDPQNHIYYQHVETFLDSHSREKCVYKGKCVFTLIKGKHDTWLARGLMTYKYENENTRLDKNLHRFFFLYLGTSQ